VKFPDYYRSTYTDDQNKQNNKSLNTPYKKAEKNDGKLIAQDRYSKTKLIEPNNENRIKQ
jgi:hypothetical protein